MWFHAFHTQKLLECRINRRGKVSALYGPLHFKKKGETSYWVAVENFLSQDTRFVVCVCRAYRSSSKTKNGVGGVFVCIGDTLPFCSQANHPPLSLFFLSGVKKEPVRELSVFPKQRQPQSADRKWAVLSIFRRSS